MKNTLCRLGICGALLLCLFLGALPMGAAISDVSISYKFDTLLPGRADGTVTVKAEGYDGEALSLFWGTEDSLLPGYQSLADLADAKVGKNGLIYTVAAPTAIPAGATHLWVTMDGMLLESLEIPEERQVKRESEPLYRFGVLSDLHFGSSKAKDSFVAAMDYFSANGSEFVLSSGDNTNGGTAAQWLELANTYKSYSFMPLWLVLGNHDALAWNLSVAPRVAMQNVKATFPNYANQNHSAGAEYTVTCSEIHPDYDYTIEYEGDLYIMMGIGAASNNSEDKNIDQRLSEYQLEWLEECLEAHYTQKSPGKAFLIFHYYTLESGMRVREGTEWNAESSSKLHRVLNKYPGVICFNGHSHFAFGKDVNSYAVKYASIHVPSLTHAGSYVKGEWETIGRQGYLVEVYEDYTLVNGIDFVMGEKAARACYRIAEDFADSVKTYGVSLRTTAGGLVQWKAKGGDSKWTKLMELSELKTDGSVQSVVYEGTSALDFRANATHIQWRVPGSGEDAWTDLIPIEDLPEAKEEGTSSENISDESPDEEDSFPLWIPVMGAAVVICVGGAVVVALTLKKKK